MPVTKKTIAKSSARKSTSVKTKKSISRKNILHIEQPILPITNSNQSSRSFGSIIKTPPFIIGLVLLLVALGYFFKSLFIVALVNGQPITRWEFNSQLEQQDGKQVLDAIVTKDLIFQAAQKQHVNVTQRDVDGQVKTITDTLTKQGTSLDAALASRGMSKQDFMDQLQIQLIAQKLFSKDVKVTDKQIDDYISQNQDSLPQGESQDQIRASVKQQLEQQQLSQKFQSWLTDLQKQAKINYFVNL